jgi:thiopeptide-type bacteriocin biosynthesis protein
MQTGIVSGFSLHSYEPELQRYGASRMELVEQFFALDSSYALKIIKTAGDFKTLQSIAIETMSTLISLAIPNPSSQHSFTKSMFENFAREFQLSAAQFQQLNADFRLFRQDNEEVHFPVSAALKLKWMRLPLKKCSQT